MAALIRLKIAVFGPMPSASVSTATAVKPGFFSSWRKANLKSFITQCLRRINLRRSASRYVTSHQCDTREQRRNNRERGRIRGVEAEEPAGEKPREDKG